jgi:hypothetical protein
MAINPPAYIVLLPIFEEFFIVELYQTWSSD